MTEISFSRQVNFESVFNFRDLGGYRTKSGHIVAWRHLFRSGELHNMTESDFKTLREKLRVISVIDLKSSIEIKRDGIGLLFNSGINYHNIPLIPDGGDRKANEQRYKGYTNLGEFYFHLIQQKEFGKRIIEALDLIAEPLNHPLVFHCTAGKDRTGVLTAILLGVLGVADEDIIADYCLSAPYTEKLFNRMKSDPQLALDAESLPDYFWSVAPYSMALFLNNIKEKYGSVRDYVKAQVADVSLIYRLEKSLLIQ